MEINSLGTIGAMQGLDWTQLGPEKMQSRLESFQGTFGGDRLDISKIGEMKNLISGMSDEGKAEMRTFHQEMQQAIRSGDFDASEMAAKAPEELKSWADEKGIDLEEMLDKSANIAMEMKEKLSGMGYNSNGNILTSFFQDPNLTTDLINQLFGDEDSEEGT